ncbi:hypothetical protein [Arthrobacter sp. UM1]|uniref:hypothetical protein n=1 Tax=Arthrobacter sp. UM1 TaxID=2766776 RepID=UPI001CF6CC8D|nr:hypothetical protein [Arthrobacter sp. UM1]MCB4207888.1 hypothetical protein [Arthrobacter sp. UM1]
MASRPQGGRWRVLAAGVILAAVTAGTWFTAQSVQSPEQRRQAAQPPERTQLTAAVERGVIQEKVQLTCRAGHLATAELSVGTPGQVVTRSFAKTGQRVVPGSVIAEVQGRPVFAVPGEFPYYRDIGIKDAGPDVDQLRRALARLGYLYVSGREGGTPAGKPVLDAFARMAGRAGYAVKEAEQVPASMLVTVPPLGGTYLTAQEEPGPAAAPFASFGLGEESWLCTGSDGTVPVGVAEGQTARLSHVQEDLRIVLGREERREAGSAAGVQSVSEGGSTGHGAGSGAGAPVGGGAAGGGQGVSGPSGGPGVGGVASKGQGASKTVVVLPRRAGEKLTHAQAEAVVKAGPPGSLIVPASALWTQDGRTVVSVVEQGKRDGAAAGGPSTSGASASPRPVRTVPVKPGLAVYGRTVVTPEDPAALAEGDQVVVSEDPSSRRGTGGR